MSIKTIILFFLAGIYFIGGGLLLRTGLRSSSPEDTIQKKVLPTQGKGGKIHHIFVGATMIAMSIVIVYKTFH